MADPFDALQITRIVISRPSYGKDQAFRAEVHTRNQFSDTALTIVVDEQQTLDLIRLVAPNIQAEMQKQIASFVEHATALALPPVEAAPALVTDENGGDHVSDEIAF